MPTPTPLAPSSDKRLFEHVADEITQMIDRGTILPGQRLPSVRRMRERFGVSISTVLEAFRLLESRGLIVAKPQSGHYVRRRSTPPLKEPSQSQPVDRPGSLDVPLSMALANDIGQPAKVQLGPAIPSVDLLPSAALSRALARVARNQPHRAHSYDVPAGTIELRRQISRRMLDAGCTVAPDELVITHGCKEAVYLALQTVTEPGDTVAVESPTYYGLLEAIHAHRLKAFPVASNPKEGICLTALEQALTRGVKAIVVIPNFSNPMGTRMSDERKRRLLQMAIAAGVPVIEDDIYGELPHDGPRPHALRAMDDGSHVIYCSSFSKTISPGLRVGWCAPGKYLPRYLQAKMMLSQMNAVPPQLAIAEYLANGGFDRHLRRLRSAYREQTARMIDAVCRYFPSGTLVSRPAGGHVIWIELPAPADALRLHREAAAEGISIAPGPLFAVHGEYRNCFRLNTGLPWSSAIDDAIRTLGQLAARQVSEGQPMPAEDCGSLAAAS